MINARNERDAARENRRTQSIIDGWWRAYDWHRSLAVLVSETMHADPDAAATLLNSLANSRRMVREMRHAAFGGSR
jgi:hypothetical protein